MRSSPTLVSKHILPPVPKLFSFSALLLLLKLFLLSMVALLFLLPGFVQDSANINSLLSMELRTPHVGQTSDVFSFN